MEAKSEQRPLRRCARPQLLGWKNLRGTPQIWPRAIQINDGPMKSNLRFTDMIDIAKGVFES